MFPLHRQSWFPLYFLHSGIDFLLYSLITYVLHCLHSFSLLLDTRSKAEASNVFFLSLSILYMVVSQLYSALHETCLYHRDVKGVKHRNRIAVRHYILFFFMSNLVRYALCNLLRTFCIAICGNNNPFAQAYIWTAFESST